MGFSYREYVAAMNAHDSERAADFMAADVVFEDIGMGVTHEGRDAVAASIEDMSDFSADVRIEVLEDFVSDGRFAAEWVMTGTTTAGGNADPVPFTVRGATVGQLDDADRVVRATDYWDMATLRSQLRAGAEGAGTGS